MTQEVQMNIRVPKALAAKIGIDKARNNTTKEIILTSILEDFFSSWSADDRAAFYKTKRPYKRAE